MSMKIYTACQWDGQTISVNICQNQIIQSLFIWHRVERDSIQFCINFKVIINSMLRLTKKRSLVCRAHNIIKTNRILMRMWLASARDIWILLCMDRCCGSPGFKWFINHSSWLMVKQVYHLPFFVVLSQFFPFSVGGIKIPMGRKCKKGCTKNAVPWNVLMLIHFESIIYQIARSCLAQSPATKCVHPHWESVWPSTVHTNWGGTRTRTPRIFHFILNWVSLSKRA